MVDPISLGKLLAYNTHTYGYPLPVDPQVVTGWAVEEGLPRPKAGKPMLYTGALYQLTPYIEALVSLVGSFKDPRLPAFGLRLAQAIPQASELLISLLENPGVVKGVKRAGRILSGMVRLLRLSGVSPTYAWEHDLYSGIILYDLGMDEDFAQHARRVHDALATTGASKIITVDPHTTHALRDLYPRYLDKYSLEVVNYLELVDSQAIQPEERKKTSYEVTLHDPCLYARKSAIVEQPRQIVKAKGLRLKEAPNHGINTYCCGGPIEALAPRLSRAIAQTRLEQLTKAGKIIITLCPICNANLKAVAKGRNGIRIIDLAEIVSGQQRSIQPNTH